uniref:Uncharacterized protein n=1 Tax=Ixodes ricinus TaxID=34613 RepID=A0A6B0U3M8_IXORI
MERRRLLFAFLPGTLGRSSRTVAHCPSPSRAKRLFTLQACSRQNVLLTATLAVGTSLPGWAFCSRMHLVFSVELRLCGVTLCSFPFEDFELFLP